MLCLLNETYVRIGKYNTKLSKLTCETHLYLISTFVSRGYALVRKQTVLFAILDKLHLFVLSIVTMPKDGLTPKMERFALNLFQGLSQRQAYIAAGYSATMLPDTIDRAAYTLSQNYKIVTRLAELQAKAVDKAVGSVIERKQRLTEIYRANLTDFIDADGNITIKPSAAIAEVVFEDWQGGKDKRAQSRTKRLKLRDPVAAITEHNKMENIYETATLQNFDQRTVNFILPNGNAKDLIEGLQGRFEQSKQLPEGDSETIE